MLSTDERMELSIRLKPAQMTLETCALTVGTFTCWFDHDQMLWIGTSPYVVGAVHGSTHQEVVLTLALRRLQQEPGLKY